MRWPVVRPSRVQCLVDNLFFFSFARRLPLRIHLSEVLMEPFQSFLTLLRRDSRGNDGGRANAPNAYGLVLDHRTTKQCLDRAPLFNGKILDMVEH